MYYNSKSKYYYGKREFKLKAMLEDKNINFLIYGRETGKWGSHDRIIACTDFRVSIIIIFCNDVITG